jgi:DNA polymerase-1
MIKKKRLFIIDAMAMAFRNFHAFGARPLMTSDGFPTSAVFGSANFLLKLIETEKPDYLLVATDSKDATFRHEIYPQYKANRSEMPEDLSKQIPTLFELFDLLGMRLLKEPGMEADDLIGSIVTQFKSQDLECFIVSGDKDFMQLIDDNTFLYSPKKGGEVLLVDRAGVFEKFSCRPDQVIEVLALTGDASDNVPGVKGIGEKGAAKLITEFHTLAGIYENLDKVSNVRLRTGLEENREMALLSRHLVTIKTDCKIEHPLEEFLYNPESALANPELQSFFERLEFGGLVSRVKIARAKAAKSVGNSTENSESGRQVDYRCVDTQEKLQQFLGDIRTASRFSFDTETTGLNIMTDKPIGISFSVRKNSAWYLPLLEKHLVDIAPDEVLASVRPLFLDPLKLKVAHNLKFDLQMLSRIGISAVGPLGDTMIAAFLIDSSGKFGLDACSERYLGIAIIPTSDLIGKKGEIPMADVAIDRLSYYAGEDADCCLQLDERFRLILEQGGLTSVYAEVDMPLVPILARMEQTGVYVGATELAGISDLLAKKGKVLEAEIYEMAGETFNINSTQQLQVILFEKLKINELLGLKRIKKTKTGFSTDVSVLEQMSDHPLPKKILEYRTVMKLKNTYVDALPQLIEPKSNRIHTSFHQTGAQTGRLSSSNPNLQNIPIRSEMGKEVRRAFKAEKDGWAIMSADYSQIELRILAHLSEDKNLIKAFTSGEDIHKATASTMFGKTLAEVDDIDRNRAKAINYGLIYGMGPQRLARITGVPLKEAKAFIAAYFAGFPSIKTYIDHAIAAAKEHGYSTTMTGRRRRIEGLDDSQGLTAVNAQNIAVNSPVQGSAADLIKLAMIKIQNRLDESEMKAKMLLQVHDELVFECPTEEVSTLTEIVRTCMEHAMELKVPLTVEIGHGRDWLEAH